MNFPFENLVSFDEAVAQVIQDKQANYFGILFDRGKEYFGVYEISFISDEEEPESTTDNVSINFEGGVLFTDGGEEEMYDVGNAPGEAKQLAYIKASLAPDAEIHMLGEYVAHSIFSGSLQEPDEIWSPTDRKKFMDDLQTLISHHWKVSDRQQQG